MPQFDPATFPSQLFWLFVTFVVLYLIVSRFAIPRIGDILEQRERVVQDDLDRAESLKAEAEQALADYESAMANARDQAREQMLQVTNAAKAESEARNKEVSAEVSAQIAEAEQRIKAASDEAMASLTSIAADAAKDAANRLAGLDVASGDAEAAVQSAMKGSA